MPGSPAPDLHGVYVFVVDDNDDARDILLTYLQYLGAVVRTARDGRTALAALGELRAHIIVADLTMPAMDGYEFLQRLRRMSKEDKDPTPVIAFSGYADEKRRAMTSGFASFIAKPADPEALAKEIERVVREARDRR